MAEPSGEPPPPTTPRSLNDFTDHLLIHIFSLLPTTLDAVRTTPAVCSRWRHLWKCVGTLNFDYSVFPPTPDGNIRTRRRFCDFVDRALILRSHSFLSKFRLHFDHGEPPLSPHIDSWIQYAVAHKTLEMYIDFLVERDDDILDPIADYEFRFSLLKNGEVRVLNLRQCIVVMPRRISNGLSSIVSMHLSQVYFEDQTVINFMSGLVNLESLVLEDCHGIQKKLRISSNNLKDLALCGYDTENDQESLEIDCPNLRNLAIAFFLMGKYSIKNLPAWVNVRVDFVQREEYYKYWEKVVRMFGGVRLLSVQNWWYGFPPQQNVDIHKRFAFNHLLRLVLYTDYTTSDLCGLAALLELCPILEVLILNFLIKTEEYELSENQPPELPKKLHLPALRRAMIRDFCSTKNECQVLWLLEAHAPNLEKVLIASAQEEGQSTKPSYIVWRRGSLFSLRSLVKAKS